MMDDAALVGRLKKAPCSTIVMVQGSKEVRKSARPECKENIIYYIILRAEDNLKWSVGK
jgi:hypothetical protein